MHDFDRIRQVYYVILSSVTSYEMEIATVSMISF